MAILNTADVAGQPIPAGSTDGQVPALLFGRNVMTGNATGLPAQVSHTAIATSGGMAFFGVAARIADVPAARPLAFTG